MIFSKLTSFKSIILLFFISYASLFLTNDLIFYNDDISLINQVKTEGIISSWENWVEHYGLFYRPIGIFILYLFYFLFNQSAEFSYYLNLIFYFISVFQLYNLIDNQFNDKKIATFISFGYLLFPLNITAYLQISSLIMIISINLFFVFLKLWIHSIKKNSNILMFLALFFWLIILLIYEQVVSLTPILVLFILKNSRQNSLLKFVNLKFIFSISITSIFFIFIYFTSALNPKMIVLKKNNKINQEIKNSVILFDEKKNNINYEFKNFQKILLEKIDDGKKKLKKILVYLSEGFKYSLDGSNNLTIILFVFCLLMLSKNIFDTNIMYQHNIYHYWIIFGSSWFLFSITPFLLYRGIVIPPYVFVLPSIGFSMIMYGLFLFFYFFISKKFYQFIIKVFVIVIFGVSYFTHLGYFYGLKHEFDYWSKAYIFIKPKIHELIIKKVIFVNSSLEKNNEHIFWITKLVGARYLQKLINLDLKHNKISTPIIIKDKNMLTIKLN